MKKQLLFASIFLVVFATPHFAQSPAMTSAPQGYRSSDPMENISSDVARTARAVETLSKSWAEFIKTFSSNQGLLLDEPQRKFLLSLEALNRFEVSQSNLIKLKLDLVERQSRIGRQLATLTDNLLPESVDRFVAQRGTTDAERLRQIRRDALVKEQRELSQLMTQITRELNLNETDLLRTEQMVRAIRNQVFGEAAKQLSNQ